jgi:hypothetical protein
MRRNVRDSSPLRLGLRLSRQKRTHRHPVAADPVHVATNLREPVGEIVAGARRVGELHQMLTRDVAEWLKRAKELERSLPGVLFSQFHAVKLPWP